MFLGGCLWRARGVESGNRLGRLQQPLSERDVAARRRCWSGRSTAPIGAGEDTAGDRAD
jgi:hypothetical protein